jgi:CheY-like chemotaxis protein
MRSGKRRALVVENDPLTTRAIKMVLEWDGYHVDCAANGLRQMEVKPELFCWLR